MSSRARCKIGSAVFGIACYRLYIECAAILAGEHCLALAYLSDSLKIKVSISGTTASGSDSNSVESALSQTCHTVFAHAQAIEQFEITRYGTLCTWARKLGHDEVGRLLEESLFEEKDAGLKLIQLAEGVLNRIVKGQGAGK